MRMLQTADLQVLIKKTIISSPFLTVRIKANFSLAIFMSLCLIPSFNCYLRVFLFLNCEMLMYSSLIMSCKEEINIAWASVS